MSLQSHLTELERRHEALDREIAREWGHPAADETKLAELKRRKLQLKDEIAKLEKEKPVEAVYGTISVSSTQENGLDIIPPGGKCFVVLATFPALKVR